jgi:proline dehydrogenase
MVNRVLMWAAAGRTLQRQVTEQPIARRNAFRFVAGERLDEALDVATALNSRRIGDLLDLLGEVVTDLFSASHAVAGYVPPSTTAIRTWGADIRTWGADAVPALGQAAERTARPSGAGDASIARAHRAPTEHRSR